MIPPDMMQRLIVEEQKKKEGIRVILAKNLPIDDEEKAFNDLFRDYGAAVRGLAVELMNN